MRVWIGSSVLVSIVAIVLSFRHLVSGDEKPPVECPDSLNVTFLDCRDRHLPWFPSIEESVINLDISFNKIGKLDQQQWPKLLHLNLSHNIISTIEDGAFIYLSNLVVLDLSYNKLSGENFTKSTFKNLKNLEVLILRGNPIGRLRNGVFDWFEHEALKYLDLSYAMISSIHQNAFDLPFLQQLLLRGNLLSEHDLDVFVLLERSLEELDISENPIFRITDKVFYPLDDLTKLTIDSCELEEFSAIAFNGLNSLVYLSLSNNSLTTLTVDTLKPLDKLEELVLDENPITAVDGSIFGEIDPLEWPIKRLRLDNMHELTVIKSKAFVNLVNLEEISIRNNDRLETIEGSVFSGGNAIRRVYLDNNRLSTLPEDLLSWEHLESINLTGNRWYCDCRWLWAVSTDILRNKSSPIICNGPLEHEGSNLLNLPPQELGCINRTTKMILLFFLVVGVIALLGFTLYFVIKYRKKSRYSLKDLLCLVCCRKKDGRYISVYQNDDTEPFTRITFALEEETDTKTAVDV